MVVALALVFGSGPAAAEGGDAAPRPRLYVIADSVVLGARDALIREFADYEVTVDGVPAIWTDVAAQLAWERRDHIGEVAVVATGHNYPYWDPARFDRMIDTMVDRLTAAGARRIIWVTLREGIAGPNTATTRRQIRQYAWYFPRVNAQLRAAQARHPTLELADWAAISAVPGITYDAIHLNSRGQALMVDLIRRTIQAGIGRLAAGERRALRPVTTPAETHLLAIEVLGPTRAGTLAVDDCHGGAATTRPVGPGPRSSLTVVAQAGAGGEVCIGADVPTHVVVDDLGPVSALAPPVVLADGPVTAGAVAAIGAPAGPPGSVRVLEVTMSDATSAAPVTVWDCASSAPAVSQLTTEAGGTTSTIVTAPATGAVCLRSLAPGRARVVDRGALVVAEAAPARRLVDTRPSAPVADARTVVDVGSVPLLIHVTVVAPASAVMVTVGPCAAGGRAVGLEPGAVRTVTLVAAGPLCAASAGGAVHVIVDGGTAPASWPSSGGTRLLDTRMAASGP